MTNKFAGLCLAFTAFLTTNAAFADSVMTSYISSDGSIVDMSGKVVGNVMGGPVVRTTTVGAPLAVTVPTSTTVVTKTIESPSTVAVTRSLSGNVSMSDVLADSIIDRREQLARDLASARARLDAARAAELQAKLDGILPVDGMARLRSDLTFEQALGIAKSLDDISGNFTTVTETKYVPLIYTDPATSTRRITVTQSVMKRME